MLRQQTIKTWCFVHKWASLVCTVFLLLLCLTGLPLIFHHEIDHALGNAIESPAIAPNAPRASLDEVVRVAQTRKPGWAVQFVVKDDDEPDQWTVSLIPRLDADPSTARSVVLDARTAQVLGEPKPEGLVFILFKLHVELFAGLPGTLFLGAMALLFVLAIVSGVVLYGPFTRKLNFGEIRHERGSRTRWLDLHNLLGIVTVTWALVVGLTGAINTLAQPAITYWKNDQLAAMVAPYKDMPPLAASGSVQQALDVAVAALPSMRTFFVAYPGTLFSSQHHYAVFMKGSEALTSRLFQPVLVDAQTLKVTDTREMPWYVKTLLVSQPLHFGDYGGMPMKVIWAMLDVMTIAVLGSGLYLWWARRKRHVRIEDEIAELSEARMS
jgi:uncharacterized iron-regulated membrane protein